MSSARHFPTQAPALPSGVDLLVHDFIGKVHSWQPTEKRLERQASRVLQQLNSLQALSNQELQQQITDMATEYRLGRSNSDTDQHALALITSAADRTLGLTPYQEQITGALTLIRGHLLEMATGEGKSLTAALSAVVLAWSGRPCHILTVNDYLAERDCAFFAPFYHFCHIEVAVVLEQHSTIERKQHYLAPLVYTTAKQLLADYLRDQIGLACVSGEERWNLLSTTQQSTLDNLVTRGIDSVIVDEADSILIDEAVSPLIISQQQQNKDLTEAARAGYQLAKAFHDQKEYLIDTTYREVELTETGKEKLEAVRKSLPGIWCSTERATEILLMALNARSFYHKEQHYIIRDKKIQIVDEFTGRIMPDRSWGRGLHQAIEAKEGLLPSAPTETITRMSFQRFFRLFNHLCGMTGTANEAKGEFWRIYRLTTITVPTHHPSIQSHWPTISCSSHSEKLELITGSVENRYQQNQPILIGTRNIHDSKLIASSLGQKGVPYEILNAEQHEHEAEIIASAGQPGRVTIATNMAGRGTDIHLGQGVEALGGLHVIISDPHEAKRIDRQLAGRCARQGAAGSYQQFISNEDGILQRFPSHPIVLFSNWLTEHHLPGWKLTLRMSTRICQHKAEQLAWKQRQAVLKNDQWLEDSLTFIQG